MAVNLVPLLAALVHQRQLKERPHAGALAGQGDEQGDINRVVLGVLPVGVEIDGPRVAPDLESVRRNVLADAEALGHGIPRDFELVGTVHSLRQERRSRLAGILRRRRRGRVGTGRSKARSRRADRAGAHRHRKNHSKRRTAQAAN